MHGTTPGVTISPAHKRPSVTPAISSSDMRNQRDGLVRLFFVGCTPTPHSIGEENAKKADVEICLAS
jgi:hypothetical protein